MIKLILAASLIFSTCISVAKSGSGSGDNSSGTRGGGNIIASEFFDTGLDILKLLEPRTPTVANGQLVDVHVLNTIFQETTLSISEENLYLNGSIVDAINYPKKNRIQINGLTWKTLSRDNRYRLVMHEILGLAGTPDVQYKTSLELLNIAYVGINWDRGYRPACHGLKFLNTEKSIKIKNATLAYLNLNPNTPNFSMPSFTCTRGTNLQGLEYTNCDLDGKKMRSQFLHEALVKALEFSGVAKYTTGSGVIETYDISGISCSATSASQVRCGITAYWNSDCKSP